MRDPGQRLVHRQMHVGIAGDAAHVAERLLDGLAERDADILGGVVVVDMQVARGLDVMSIREWRASRSSMWSRKPIPVAIDGAPLPSRSTATAMSVSLVVRLTVALRMAMLPFARPCIRASAGLATAAWQDVNARLDRGRAGRKPADLHCCLREPLNQGAEHKASTHAIPARAPTSGTARPF